mmetsp:Transcript_9603/g.12154  ORF Transcript_9603/g.12154 Transcript_9603/m.12154 type:complete len:515 (-) Transcript_9603:81-1625(-)
MVIILKQLLLVLLLPVQAISFVSPKLKDIQRTTQPTKLQDSFLDDRSIINAHIPQHILTSSKELPSSSSLYSNSLFPSSSSSTQPTSNTNKVDSHHEDILEYSRRRVNNRHSAKDWLHNVASLPKSTVLKEIRHPVISVASWSTSISILYALLTPKFPALASKMCIGTQLHSLMISSLGLLLVFRTNSAYQRFVEGRKIWEQILSTSRNLNRLMNLYEDEIGLACIHRVRHYLASFPYLLRHHIRPRCLGCKSDVPLKYRVKLQESPYDLVETRHEGDTNHGGVTYTPDDEDYNERSHSCWVDQRNLPWRLLNDKALSKCAKAINRPLWACNSIANDLVKVPYGPNFTSRERLTLLSHVDKLSNAIGQCERIHQTAVPLNYARHALRSLTVWLFTLPFSLVKDLGLLTGPICAIIAWLMFGVYQIGHSIEDPFQKTLRLSILCNAIRKDVLGANEYGSVTSSSLFDGIDGIEDETEKLLFPLSTVSPLISANSIPFEVMSKVNAIVPIEENSLQ